MITKNQIHEVTLQKVIYGGQTLAELSDGKKVFVWGGLPGETASVRVHKSKRNWAEAIIESVITKSDERIAPADPDSFLSTSPWQIYNYDYENKLKQELIIEQFTQHHLGLILDNFTAPEEPLHYRNKIEFSFWWSNESEQLDLAFYKRGTHIRQPVEGTSLGKECLNQAAVRVRDYLRLHNVQARDLKSLILRCSQDDVVVAQLYVKESNFPLKPLAEELDIAGISIQFSNPKSPASIITKTLHANGAQNLSDIILDARYSYSVDGFFQVSIPMYESALEAIRAHIDPSVPLVDMYSGVGSIGLSLAAPNQQLTLIELDERSIKEAKANASQIKPDTKVIHARSESAVEYITSQATVVLDPPRAGLHQRVIDQLLDAKPKTVVYLSCNPATQARDIALLQSIYKPLYAHGFNFFPRTPHIENLVILQAQ